MKVFLTGAAGYLGDHVRRALLARGHEVTALVRRPSQAAEILGSRCIPLVGDITHPEGWSDRLGAVDAVVHTAGRVETWARDAQPFHRVNVLATLDLVERARAAGVTRIVVTNTLFTLGPSGPGEILDEGAVGRVASSLRRANAYVHSKSEAAVRLWALQARGHPVIVLYPTVLLGPGRPTRGNHTAHILISIGRGRFPGLVGDGEQRWNLVPVEDAARGHVLAMERGLPGENYILAGENWTQRRLVERAATLLGVKPPVRPLGRRLPMAVALACELWARITGRSPFLTRGEVKLYDADWAFSATKARRELDWVAGDVEGVLSRTASWIREQENLSRRKVRR